MIAFSYLLVLLFSISGMIILDRQHRLAFFCKPRRAAAVLGLGVLLFVFWDALGIWLGIFFDGKSQFTTGIMVAPELPIEEFFFLFFLCYFTLITYRLVETKW